VALVGYFQAPIASRTLGMPVAHMKLSDMRDTFNEMRGRQSTALRPPISWLLAATPGPGSGGWDHRQAVYERGPADARSISSIPSERYCYYYAHLDAYAANLAERMKVRRGRRHRIRGNHRQTLRPTSPTCTSASRKSARTKKWWGGNARFDPYPILRASGPEARSEELRFTGE